MTALSLKQYVCGGSVSDSRFREELEAHATGFLAPLIKKMSVTCDSEMLPDGVVLVDLPGLGVAGDIHKEVTSSWVARARAFGGTRRQPSGHPGC